VSGRDWFRSSVWNEQVAAAFEERLRRARQSSRAQYLRIQATHLLESTDSATREAGHRLLHRVVSEYPDDEIEVKGAWEQLAASLMQDGRIEEAEHAFRRTLALIASSPIGRSGTSGVTELQLAELLLATRDPSRLTEAGQLLVTARSEVEKLSFLRDVMYRYLLASARHAHRIGDDEASKFARHALAIAAETQAALPRHPTIGRPSTTDEEMRELRAIAEAD
jgi:hypothetical protein